RGGGGHYSKPRENQTITSTVIYSALFQNESSVFSSRSEKMLRVSHPHSPVTIKDELVYFWDQKYLPIAEWNQCSEYVTSNSKQKVKFCNVSEMARCSRRMDSASELRPFSFYSSSSSFLTSFAWLCPNKTVCCEWECCSPHQDAPFDFFLFLLVLFFIILFVGGTIGIVSESPFKKPQQYAPPSVGRAATTNL
ncbi:hypothetical protein PMAYCL1PPCAC_23188, partial [Pristionchus mayeri]